MNYIYALIITRGHDVELNQSHSKICNRSIYIRVHSLCHFENHIPFSIQDLQ
jgi:hypothetical protein